MTTVRALIVSARQGDDEAIRTLSAMAAKCLSERAPLPEALADYLASALGRAATARAASNGQTVQQAMISELAHGLGLKRAANRPRLTTPDAEIIAAIAMYGDDLSQTAIATALAETSNLKLRAAQNRVADAKDRIATSKGEVWTAYVRCRLAAARLAQR